MMITQLDLEHLYQTLRKATGFRAIFGPLPTGDVHRKCRAVRKSYHYLAQLVHPDHAADSQKKLASETFQLLSELRRRADQAIQSGTYDKPFSSLASKNGANHDGQPVILQSALASYQLDDQPAWRGDFSALYRARNLTTSKTVIVKVTRDPRQNGRLEQEGVILSQFNGPRSQPRLSKLGPFVPLLTDTFMISGSAGKRYRVNVLADRPGFQSLTDIRSAFPAGLDPRDAAWIFRRVLAQTLAASMAGVVHGAITPDHVLVDPITHEPLHLGWAMSVPPDKPLTMITTRWREFYPPEVFRKQPVDHRTDLYMAGQTMIYLLGGDLKRKILPSSLPEPVARIILACVNDVPARRPNDGHRVLTDFTAAITAAWGRTYRPLMLPTR